MKSGNRKLVLGVTGAIASGKSEIRRALESAGCLGIDADLVSHELIHSGEPAYTPIVARYGEAVLQSTEISETQEINRKELARIVFSDENELKWLESVLHPAVTQRIRSLILAAERPVVIEAIKLMDSGLKNLCTQCWLADADEKIRIARLMEKRGYSYETAVHRIAAQKSIDWNSYRFDAIIDTAVPLEELWEHTLMLWNRLIQDDSGSVFPRA